MSTQSDVKGLGKIVVANAGTPVPIKSASFMVRSFTVQADPANAGTYCFVKDINGNICAKFQKGQSFTPPQPYPFTAAGFDLSQVQIDSDTNGDGCYICYV